VTSRATLSSYPTLRPMGTFLARTAGMHGRWIAPVAAFICVVVVHGGCAMFWPKRMESSLGRPPTPEELAALWVDPVDIASRDLFHGVGGRERAPVPGATYQFLKRDRTGFSRGWHVKSADGTRWSVKIGLEAQTEVVASRITWAAGYRQPPTYYLRDWRLAGCPEEGPQYPGRFRPEISGMEKVGEWSFHKNPFVGSQPYKGLLVLMLILNNWDLLERNTARYALEAPPDGIPHWYVVRDLGAALGRSRFFPQGTRNDLEGFEREDFVNGVRDHHVRFAYRGRHRELFRDIGPEDVRWICHILDRLTPRQWRDAFRAGGYADETTERYVRAIRRKVEQGLTLGSTS
jgi:hypothetical protein